MSVSRHTCSLAAVSRCMCLLIRCVRSFCQASRLPGRGLRPRVFPAPPPRPENAAVAHQSEDSLRPPARHFLHFRLPSDFPSARSPVCLLQLSGQTAVFLILRDVGKDWLEGEFYGRVAKNSYRHFSKRKLKAFCWILRKVINHVNNNYRPISFMTEFQN